MRNNNVKFSPAKAGKGRSQKAAIIEVIFETEAGNACVKRAVKNASSRGECDTVVAQIMQKYRKLNPVSVKILPASNYIG